MSAPITVGTAPPTVTARQVGKARKAFDMLATHAEANRGEWVAIPSMDMKTAIRVKQLLVQRFGTDVQVRYVNAYKVPVRDVYVRLCCNARPVDMPPSMRRDWFAAERAA